MSRIANAFANGKAFIPFITCGDPDLATTEAVVRAAVANGADLIELGIPFSDPTAEGPVIQGANLRALNGGIKTDHIFEFVKKLRQDIEIPMVFMTYANVVYSYGSEKFLSNCKEVGIDGLISLGGTGFSFTCISATETGLSALNGSSPVAISYIVTPREYRSLLVSIVFPLACSGLM